MRHAIALLAREDVATDVFHALHAVGPRIIGQLSDALLDTELPPIARRRVARLLCGARTPRAIEAVMYGLE